MIESALKYLKAGYSVIPVDGDKQSIYNWTKFQKTPMTEEQAKKAFEKAEGIALICYDYLEVLDFDLKYDLTDTLWFEYMRQVPDELKAKLLINKTRNGGYHVLYKCDKTESNHQLARRQTTVHEQHETYLKNYLNPKTQDKALRIALQDKMRVLIETRGGVDGVGGGYVLVPPTAGYERIQGKLTTITVEERDFLHNLARSFDTYEEINSQFINKKSVNRESDDENPFDDFNNRVDMLQTMLSYGWTVVSENSKVVRLLRPGDTKSKSSGVINKDTNILKVFSTSHILYRPDGGVNTATVFTEFECDGDKKVAYQKLVDMGYGKPKKIEE